MLPHALAAADTAHHELFQALPLWRAILQQEACPGAQTLEFQELLQAGRFLKETWSPKLAEERSLLSSGLEEAVLASEAWGAFVKEGDELARHAQAFSTRIEALRVEAWPAGWEAVATILERLEELASRHVAHVRALAIATHGLSQVVPALEAHRPFSAH